MEYLRVAVDTPFNKGILTYLPSQAGVPPARGELCYAPLGKRKARACVLGPESGAKDFTDLQVRALGEAYAWQLKLPDSFLNFLEWVAQYYQYSLGQLIFEVLPRPMKRPRQLGFIDGECKRTYQLYPAQEEAWKKLEQGFSSGFAPYLLHGITGSGKSIVYFKAIQKAVSTGRSALLLLPEINLTPQFLGDLENSVEAPIFSYHSNLSASDRYGLWDKLCRGESGPLVIVGVRSAVFLPIPQLGLIVVDEEHDTSFKQEDRCPYNARDLALKRGSLLEIPVVLGSATPSLETFHRYQGARLRPYYLSLPQRYHSGALPHISLINTAQQSLSAQDSEACWPFEVETLQRIERRLKMGEQVLVFVNRLGLALYLQCRGCGHSFDCPHCSVSLRVFHKRRRLNCQICQYREDLPEACPKCGNLKLEQRGFGTERLEQVLKSTFPNACVGRFDRDEVSTFAEAKKRLASFERGEIDILVGTQMLAKGHNFSKVNLVVVLGIDGQLNFPDFRSFERAFQLLTQISGRAGRFAEGSEVVVQTACPEHRLFKWVQKASFENYYNDEIRVRKLCECPPFGHLAMLYFSSKKQEHATQAAERAQTCGQNLCTHFPGVQVLGPRPAIIEKRANLFTWVVMLKAGERSGLHKFLHSLGQTLTPARGVSAKIDIDPYSIN